MNQGLEGQLGRDAELFKAEVAFELFGRCVGIREVRDGEATLSVE